MRRASFDKKSNTKYYNGSYSAVYNYSKSSNLKNVEIKRQLFQSSGQTNKNNTLQKSFSADNVIIRSRGFKPSDIHDPVKRHILENLTSKILHFDMDSGERTKKIEWQKLLTPAMDATDTSELLQSKKKMYASSCFYAPTHPTVEDQVELARRISYSLSDVKNMKSKGQSMYVNRKKRSVKWIHDGNGEDGEEGPQMPLHRDKTPLKCMMNPNGKVLDINGIQALGEEPNIGQSPINAEKLFDIVRDLNCQKGRGAEIFAKRRKRSEKWVVENDAPPTPVTPVTLNYPKLPSYPSKMDYGTNENSKLNSQSPMSPVQVKNDSKPFYNPFTVDLSLGTTPAQPDNNESNNNNNKQPIEDNYQKKYEGDIKKIYLREIAVGTEQDYPVNGNQNDYQNGQQSNQQNGHSGVEKSRRMSFDSDCYQPIQQNGNRNYSMGDQGSRGGSSCNGRAQMGSVNSQIMNGHYQNGNSQILNGNYNIGNGCYQMADGNYQMGNINPQIMANGYHQMPNGNNIQMNNGNIQMANGYPHMIPPNYQMTNFNSPMNNGNYQIPNGNYQQINHGNLQMINGNSQMNNNRNYQMRNENLQNGNGYSNKMSNGYSPNVNMSMANGYNNKNINPQINNGNYQIINKNTQIANGNGQTRNENSQISNGNQLQNETINEEDNPDYTPVPVKQLIQEFEKTCRPTLQYKQINSKAVPIIQQTPHDDLSRFFDMPRMQNNNKQQQFTNVNNNNNNNNLQYNNGNNLNNNNNKMMNPNVNGNNNGYGRIYQGAMVPRYEYDSTDDDDNDDDDDDDDDDEIGDSFGESTSPENCNDYYSGPSPGFSTGNRVSAMSDYDYRRQLFDQASEQLFDAPVGYRNGDVVDDKLNGQAKNKPMAIIPSEEDIIEQIKQLRKTPVDETLLPAPPAEKLGDYCQDLGTKLLESTYNGPKISSFQTNYNTAPRGWDQAQSFYRPVTFAKSQEPIAYSDF